MAVAAEFPDIDTLWSLRGPVSGFAHHRGITHTFVGVPLEAALLVGIAWSFHAYRERARPESERGPRRLKAPVRWAALYGCAVLALLSHLLLDWTNNYGVRPFFPFNSHWYAGSFVFIVDPSILLLLLAGLVLPALFRMVRHEIGAREEAFHGTSLARAALLLILCVWGFRAYFHHNALEVASSETLRAPVQQSEDDSSISADRPMAPVAVRPLLRSTRAWASPDPLNPLKWYTVSDFGMLYQAATVTLQPDSYVAYRALNKAQPSFCLEAAESSRLGRVYLDWSPMPWVTTSSATAAGEDSQDVSCVVLFRDPRFITSSPFLNRGAEPPLTGTVLLNRANAVVAQGMDQRFER